MNKPTMFPSGIITANLTPLKSDLSVDVDLLQEHCRLLLANGSDGLALLGTTGEANSFSVSERRQIVEAMSDFDPNLLMVGTGCNAYPETVELTKHALDHGINNFLVLPPFFYKQVDDDGLLSYFDKTIHKIGSDRLSMYLYHFPKMAGVSFSHDSVRKLIKAFPETIVGMKDSSGDAQHMQEIREMFPGFRLYAGTETYLFENLVDGGAGCISATANVTVKLIADTLRTWQEDNQKADVEYMIKVRRSFEGLPFSGALKSYLANATGNTEWLNVRPPNQTLAKSLLQNLLKRHQELAFNY